MRFRFLLLALLAAPAAAEPSIRWIDEKGSVHRAAIAEVKSESATEIKIEQSDGKPLTVLTSRLLTMVREDDTDPEQRALLRARGSTYLGGGLADARATCDRLIKNGKQEWIREYAAVHRALIAVRAREPGARKRVLDCLDKYPSTRFLGRLIFARAQAQARGAKTAWEAGEVFDLAFDDIQHAKGPVVIAFECFIEQGRLHATGDWRSVASFAQGLRGRFARELEEARPDGGLSVVLESAILRIEMAWHEERYADAKRRGDKPVAPRDALVALRRRGAIFLPSLRSDIAHLLGRTQAACGDSTDAKASFAASLKLAPDPWRRARAARRARPQ